MKWFNAEVDGSPEHGDEVIISVDGVYHLAVYSGSNKTYISKRSKKSFKASESTIYWAKIVPPTN